MMKGRYLRAPKLSDVPYPVQMEPHLVVEFYSRTRRDAGSPVFSDPLQR